MPHGVRWQVDLVLIPDRSNRKSQFWILIHYTLKTLIFFSLYPEKFNDLISACSTDQIINILLLVRIIETQETIICFRGKNDVKNLNLESYFYSLIICYFYETINYFKELQEIFYKSHAEGKCQTWFKSNEKTVYGIQLLHHPVISQVLSSEHLFDVCIMFFWTTIQ